MTNIQNLFLRALLALSILVAAPAALAGPLYRVSLETAAWAGQSGYLDLSFGGYTGVGPARATVTNLRGDFDDSIDVYFESLAGGNRAEGFTLVASDMLSLVSQAVTFGGIFSFDLRFDEAATGLGADFGISLVDTDFAPLTGDFPALTFFLVPGEETTLVGAELARVETLAEVPEPSDWLLVGTGLFLLGATRRLQQRR
ncbi:NF038129 family PEP-CTERM protein [Massilia consociata]|uniref:NF038129 family PEP-CTERM protein n=1 Tax=Massilia consociata TaxID=760117 RepID=A0ABV6FBI8_9BURK